MTEDTTTVARAVPGLRVPVLRGSARVGRRVGRHEPLLGRKGEVSAGIPRFVEDAAHENLGIQSLVCGSPLVATPK